MRAYQVLHWVPTILRELDAQLISDASAITYGGPFRALPQRFYRAQDLRVDRVDPDGSNLAVFLSSLSQEDREAFSDFTASRFGFGVRVVRNEGLIRIHILDDAGASPTNLIDSGFGLSQLMPVIAQAWSASRQEASKATQRARRLRPGSKIVALEQPELHLHPAHQAALGETLVRLGDASPDTRFVIETHSADLINAVGRLIRSREVSSDKVIVYRFEQSESAETLLEESRFGTDGVLMNWPFGFLSA
jgi:hypothetical protein